MSRTNNILRFLILTALLTVLTGCGGGGGSATPDVPEGPAPANGNPEPPDPVPAQEAPNTYEAATSINAVITAVQVSGAPVVSFTVVDGEGYEVTGLTNSNIRFTIAKLVPSENGSGAAWQSYINRIKTPAVTPENDPAVQATYERDGVLEDHNDGTYTYTFVTDITNVSSPLAVLYEPDLTHRVAMQFGGGPLANPVYDWIPATGQADGVFTNQLAHTATCNGCHDPLALHGGGRQEIAYCVTCHNPGTSEPNSQTDMDMKVLIHKIHMGSNLPSVQAGGEYVVYGFRDSRHDYSHVHYPQNPANCTGCHAGTATAADSLNPALVVTNEGDNWAEVPSMAACGSCHDDVDFSVHAGGQVDDSGCQSCHSVMGDPGSVIDSHRDPVIAGMREFQVNILDVDMTAPGQFPEITFSVTNPQSGDVPYDLQNDPVWSDGRLSAGIAINTDDFTNTGLGDGLPSYGQTNALEAVSNGDGSYTIASTVAIPDGSVSPGVAATGSGMVTFEGRTSRDLGEAGTVSVPFEQPHLYFSIDETDGVAQPRREVVSIEKCNACHAVKVNHGANRTNNIAGCAGCHNPRNTDAAVRATAFSPPTDGKDEQSIDFKVLIHGLHASAFVENPLQVVGFRGFSTHVFDEEHVQYPGRIANCEGCHLEGTYQLPVNAGVLATSIDTGDDPADPGDDIMVTPETAVCSSCHDSEVAAAHMVQNGGDFQATQTSLAQGVSTEACSVCHGEGRQADVELVHEVD